MMKRKHRLAVPAALLCLAGCGSGSDDGVGGVSASEARALNAVAATLDARTDAAQDAVGDGQTGLNPAARVAAAADRGRKAAAAQDGATR